MIPSRTLPQVTKVTPKTGDFITQDYSTEIGLLIQASISWIEFTSTRKTSTRASVILPDPRTSVNSGGRPSIDKTPIVEEFAQSVNDEWIKLLESSNNKAWQGASDDISLGTERLDLKNINKPNDDIPQIRKKMIGRELGRTQPNTEGFRLLTYKEKSKLFGGKRDDLFYKTFVRDVRKFWEDRLIEQEKVWIKHVIKNKRDKKGAQFYKSLQEYENYLQLSAGEDFTSEDMVWYLGSLINHREFIKACPKNLTKLSDEIHYVFTKFTKERLYKLCKTPQFRILFRKYAEWVNQENDYERLRTHKTIGANLAPYMVVYKEFVRVWLNEE